MKKRWYKTVAETHKVRRDRQKGGGGMMKLFVVNAMVSTSMTIAIRASMMRCYVVASGWWFAVLAIYVMALMYGGDGKKGGEA